MPVGERNALRRTNLSSFLNSCVREYVCLRCGSSVDKEQEHWSAIGQVLERQRINGGMLCEKCSVSFIEWMSGGDADGESNDE